MKTGRSLSVGLGVGRFGFPVLGISASLHLSGSSIH